MNKTIIKHRSFLVMMQFLYRDFAVYGRKFKDQFINIIFLYPLCLGISGVVVSNIFFDSSDVVFGTTNMFATAPILPLLVLTYHLMFELFYDLEGSRFINYQQVLLPPYLILIEKMIMGTLISFFSIVPFYPISYFFIFRKYVSVENAQWVYAYVVLFFASFCLCAYNLCAAIILRRETLNIFWNRINHCVLMFGGFLVPSSLLILWWAPAKFILLFNPLHFFSEALRSSIVGTHDFLPYQYGILGLFMLGVCFGLIAIYAFKKRIDHI